MIDLLMCCQLSVRFGIMLTDRIYFISNTWLVTHSCFGPRRSQTLATTHCGQELKGEAYNFGFWINEWLTRCTSLGQLGQSWIGGECVHHHVCSKRCTRYYKHNSTCPIRIWIWRWEQKHQMMELEPHGLLTLLLFRYFDYLWFLFS